MRIHILGFGAIGTLVSCHLRAALDKKHTVTVLHKTASAAYRASKLRGVKLECGGSIQSRQGILHASVRPHHDFLLQKWFAEAAARKRNHRHKRAATSRHPRKEERVPVDPIDTLIVAIKAQDTAFALRSLMPRLSAKSTVVLLHNGMGVYEHVLLKTFQNEQDRPHFVASVNTHGAFLKQVGHVVHTGVGSIQLGIMPDPHRRDFEASLDTSLPKEDRRLSLDDITPLQGDPDVTRYLSLRNTITAMTSAAPLDVSWQPLSDVQVAMHRKLAVNCVINPLTAVLGCRNGDILTHPAGRHLAMQLCYEASNVFFSQWKTDVWKQSPKDGSESDASPDPDADLAEVQRELPFPPALYPHQLYAECARVAKLTQHNVSSMLVDVRRNRSTEIKHLNGYILNLAKKYDVRVPVTAAVVDFALLRSHIPIDKPVPLNRVV